MVNVVVVVVIIVVIVVVENRTNLANFNVQYVKQSSDTLCYSQKFDQNIVISFIS